MENEANKAMSGGSNGLPNNDTHVGYGRNRGDGSDAQNQQPVDALQRYTDQSDSFVGKVTKGMMELIESNKEFGIPAESSLDGVSPEVYKRVLSENANTMFEKAPVQFKDALNAMMSKMDVPCMVGTSSDGRCCYSARWNSVYMTREYFENNGSPYQEFWEVLLHEYSHAIDYNLGDEYQGRHYKPASFSMKLQSTGGLTLLEAAVGELGNESNYSEYSDFVGESDPFTKYEKRHYELKEEENRLGQEIASLGAKALAQRFGYDEKDAKIALNSLSVNSYGIKGKPDDFMMQLFISDNMKDGITSLFLDESFSDVRNESENIMKQIGKIRKEDKALQKTRVSFETRFDRTKEFLYLNDIMSAVNGGKSHPVLGYGHDSEYYKDDDAKATEIFANIAPVLAQNGKAAEWLKEKAPKLVAGYYELLGLALNKFKL